ncbi:MAG TPA: hypothetical protein PLL94_11045 [Bacteroidales bacterium]|nr:hypothetical protein [Bacteroidales bacterium]HQK68671.1 hypothetical protein [Bacteroidales bacterium]
MTKKDLTRTEGHQKKGPATLKENIIVFAFFLFLSFVFWYLNSLGKDLEADIKYPVTYINPPKNKTFDDGLPSRLNLYMKGPGYSMLQLKLSGKRSPIVVDFSKVIYKPLSGNESVSSYYLVTSGMISDLNSQLKSPCKISGVKPDTLFFTFN